MAIQGLEGVSPAELQDELSRGARFVVFSYTISILIMTFRRSSEIRFLRSDGNALLAGLPYTLVSLLLGWWGFPWGFIYTPMSILENLSGGRDVTSEVRSHLGV